MYPSRLGLFSDLLVELMDAFLLRFFFLIKIHRIAVAAMTTTTAPITAPMMMYVTGVVESFIMSMVDSTVAEPSMVVFISSEPSDVVAEVVLPVDGVIVIDSLLGDPAVKEVIVSLALALKPA